MKLKKHIHERLLIVLPTFLATFAVDQLTKRWAIGSLKGRLPEIYLGDFFRFEYSENPGAFLGLGLSFLSGSGSGYSPFLSPSSSAFQARSCSRPKMTRAQTASLALLISGGVSNLWDRIFREKGHVVDFMNLGIGSLRTGIFNVADIAIMAGLAIFILFQPKEK